MKYSVLTILLLLCYNNAVTAQNVDKRYWGVWINTALEEEYKKGKLYHSVFGEGDIVPRFLLLNNLNKVSIDMRPEQRHKNYNVKYIIGDTIFFSVNIIDHAQLFLDIDTLVLKNYFLNAVKFVRYKLIDYNALCDTVYILLKEDKNNTGKIAYEKTARGIYSAVGFMRKGIPHDYFDSSNSIIDINTAKYTRHSIDKHNFEKYVLKNSIDMNALFDMLKKEYLRGDSLLFSRTPELIGRVHSNRMLSQKYFQEQQRKVYYVAIPRKDYYLIEQVNYFACFLQGK